MTITGKSEIVWTPSDSNPLIPHGATGDLKSRLLKYKAFLDQQSRTWIKPDLNAYTEYLREAGLSETSISAHLSTVRERYRQIVTDRDRFYTYAPEGSPADRKAVVDEIVKRIEIAIDNKRVKLHIVKVQDENDLDHVRLTKAQADQLLHAPGVMTLRGVRDTAMIALMMCTGVREAELAALEVQDLDGALNEEPALIIRHGKGNKQRLVPYGELTWCLSIVHEWLRRAKIDSGYIFRRIRRGGSVGHTKLTTRAIEMMMTQYKVLHGKRMINIHCHDLRRTYARRLYDDGFDPVRIQQNLGHSDLQTTLGYIGALDGKKRRPPAIYNVPADILELFEDRIS